MATAAAGEHTVEQQLAAVREKISQSEDQLDLVQDREMLMLLHQRLVKLQEKELLLMQRQQSGELERKIDLLTDQVAKLAASSGCIISEPALEVLRRSVFLLLSHVSGSGMSTSGSGSSSEAGGSSIDSSRCGGVGVCVSERQAITAAHNLDGSDVGDSVKVFFPASRQQLQLKVVVKNTELDYAVLSATGDMLFSTYPPLYGGPSSSLIGKQLVMCAFQLGVRDELSEWSSSSVGVMPATGVKLSRQEHHLLYTADTWPGDSGGALVVYSGELVGLHMCGVNALKEKFQQMRSLDERISAVEESLESAARSVASGCIALLANAFAADIVR